MAAEDPARQRSHIPQRPPPPAHQTARCRHRQDPHHARALPSRLRQHPCPTRMTPPHSSGRPTMPLMATEQAGQPGLPCDEPSDATPSPSPHRHHRFADSAASGPPRPWRASRSTSPSSTAATTTSSNPALPVATAGLSAPSIAAPIRHMLRHQRNCTVLMAEVARIDKAARRAPGRRAGLAYDALIVATGATHSYFGRDDWAPHALGLKSLADAFQSAPRCSAPSSKPSCCPARGAQPWLNSW